MSVNKAVPANDRMGDIAEDEPEVVEVKGSKIAGMWSQYQPDPDDDNGTKIKKFIIRNALVIIVVVVALIIAISVKGTMSDRSDKLDEQSQEIESVKTQINTEKSLLDEKSNKVIQDANGGVNIDHRRSDDKTMDQFARAAMTWDGLSDYVDVRKNLIATYGMNEASQFFTEYMPSDQAGLIRTAPSGKTYTMYDADLRSGYVGMDSMVTGVENDVYSYATVIAARTFSGKGDASVVQYSTFTYKIVDGQIRDLHGDTAKGGVTKSG